MLGTKGKIGATILCFVCAALPTAAQTAVPEDMALVPAGKFWMGRYYGTNIDAIDLVFRAHMDDRPANNVYPRCLLYGQVRGDERGLRRIR